MWPYRSRVRRRGSSVRLVSALPRHVFSVHSGVSAAMRHTLTVTRAARLACARAPARRRADPPDYAAPARASCRPTPTAAHASTAPPGFKVSENFCGTVLGCRDHAIQRYAKTTHKLCDVRTSQRRQRAFATRGPRVCACLGSTGRRGLRGAPRTGCTSPTRGVRNRCLARDGRRGQRLPERLEDFVGVARKLVDLGHGIGNREEGQLQNARVPPRPDPTAVCRTGVRGAGQIRTGAGAFMRVDHAELLCERHQACDGVDMQLRHDQQPPNRHVSAVRGQDQLRVLSPSDRLALNLPLALARLDS